MCYNNNISNSLTIIDYLQYHSNVNMKRQRTSRGGVRKRRQITVHTGHRPSPLNRPKRPPSSLIHVPLSSHNSERHSNTETTLHSTYSDITHHTQVYPNNEDTLNFDSDNTHSDINQMGETRITHSCPKISDDTGSMQYDRAISANTKCGLLNARSVCTFKFMNKRIAKQINKCRNKRINKAIVIHEYIVDNDFDILFITETWLQDHADAILNQLIPHGYSYITCNRANGHRGGGLMVIFKNNLAIKEVKKTSSPDSYESMECLLRTEHGKVFHFILIYRPTKSEINKSTHAQFLQEFHEHVIERTIRPNENEPYFLGDFNIHVNNENDKDASNFLSMIDSCNFEQLVKTSTHDLGNTLDLILSHQQDNLIQNVQVESNHFSDHKTIVFDFIMNKPKHQRKTIRYRKTKTMNIDEFKADIISSGLTEKIENAETVKSKLLCFNETMSKLMDKHAPVVEKVVTLRPDTSWFNDEIRVSKQRRRAAEATYRRTKSAVDKKAYQKARNETNALISKAKEDQIKKKVFECKSNSRELFSVLNGMIKNEQASKSLPSHLNQKELANTFNRYFIEKIDTIRSKLDQTQTTGQGEIDCETTGNASPGIDPAGAVGIMSEFQLASEDEITELIKRSPNKQCPLDVIPTWLIKSCVNEVAPSIVSIANESMKNADFPPVLKEAIITPLIKKKGLDNDILKNYRPVSNLNFISKIIEKLVVKRINNHITSNNLQAALQSAYKAAHSTETALLRVHNDIVNLLQTNENALLLLLDLSAAFDTVDHKILLRRMDLLFGIRGASLEWFSNYLSGRTQCVRIDGMSSAPSVLKFGVPQGSVLGPYLFTMYTLPLDNILSAFGLNYHFYADDTQLYCPVSASNSVVARQALANCIIAVKQWMKDNKLQFNDEKTELITFRKKGTDVIIDSLPVGDVVIDSSKAVRNLGFHFDEHLEMTVHVAKVCQTLHYILRNICRIRHLLDEETCKLLVHALVTSRIDYCNSLLYGLPKKTLKKLQVMQNKAARIVTGARQRDHITPVLRSLHWLPVAKRVDYKIACLTHSCIHQNAPTYLQNLITVNKPTRNLRSTNSIHLQKNIAKNKFTERSFAFSAPTIWNSLSPETRNCLTLDSFKKSLKTELFRRAFD